MKHESKIKFLFFSTLALNLLFVLPALSSTDFSSAGSSEVSADLSERSEKKLGAYLGILGDPAPTLMGVNVGYNFSDWMRFTLGFGQVESESMSYDYESGNLSTETTGKLTTIGGGARVMVPGWSFSPVAGVSVGYMKLSGAFSEVQGLSESGVNAYGTVGFDYQARTGFNLAMGYNFPLGNDMESNPYLNLGWFFDLGI